MNLGSPLHVEHRRAALFLLALLLTASAIHAENWSRFRGPNGSGVAAGTGYPAEFGPDKNLLWKSAVAPGKSSPILTARHVFLTAFAGEKLLTQCFDRGTGKLLWERSVGRERKANTHRLNEPAAITPVTDGSNVYVFFEDWGLLSYDDAGELRWKTPLGPFTNAQGLGISPILADGLLVLQVDQLAGSYIAAFDPSNGETVWKTEREERDAWSTPVVYRSDGGSAQILTVGDRRMGAHDLKSGKRTFTLPALAGAIVASPVLAGNTLYAFGYSFGRPLPFDARLAKLDKNGDGVLGIGEYEDNAWLTGMARFSGNQDGVLNRAEWDDVVRRLDGPSRLVAMRLEPGAEGGVLRASEIWKYEKSFVGVIPSPLLYDGVLYFVKNGGILTAMDAATGKMLKQGRLKDAIDPYSASPVAADGKIYFASETGKLSVVAPGAAWEVIAVNDLNEEIYATPALSDGKIFVRTMGGLYCFGK